MTSVADRITNKVAGRGSGAWVCTPGDFLGLGSRHAVDQALSRLVKAGKLRRIGRGLYDMPRFSGVLDRPAPADLDAAVSALARRDGVRIMPDGLVAANRLGLTNAVPAKASYITDGSSRTLQIDGRTVRFRHGRPRIMQWTGRPAAPVVQALEWLGPDAASDAQVVAMLRHRLPDEVKHDLKQNINDVPGWAVPLARSIVSGFEEATPGSVRLVPQPGLRETIERDYAAMQDMILGDAPEFEWINAKLQEAEDAIN